MGNIGCECEPAPPVPNGAGNITAEPDELQVERISSSVSAPLLHDMYVVPLQVLLEMKNVEAHQELQERGVLRVVQPQNKDCPVIFVSHQWLSVQHPDPHGEQFRVLQAALRRLLAGYKVRSSWKDYIVTGQSNIMGGWAQRLKDAVVWYDYFSVPQILANRKTVQGDLLKAVSSIPAYVEMTDYFFVLCPLCNHIDFEDRPCSFFSWKERGWCRMESFAQYLTSQTVPAIIIRSEHQIELESLSEEIFRAPGLGNFSCCAMEHKVRHADGTMSEITCDKEYIAEVLSQIIDGQVQSALAEGKLFDYRWRRALRANMVLAGLEGFVEASEAGTVDAFLVQNRFKHPGDGEGGWTPLRWAVIGGNVEVVRGLAALGVDLEAPTTAPLPSHCHLKGTTVLGAAMTFGRGRTGRQILELLLNARADPHCRTTDFHKLHAPAVAAYFGNLEALGWWLDCVPDWDVNQPEGAFGHSIWGLMLERCPCDVALANRLLERGLDLGRLSALNASHALISCINQRHDSCELLDFLRLHGQDQVDLQRVPRAMPGTALTLLGHLAVRLGATDPLLVHMDLYDGITALHAAVDNGKLQQARWLLAHRADPSIANRNGVTPLALAEGMRQGVIAVELRRAMLVPPSP